MNRTEWMIGQKEQWSAAPVSTNPAAPTVLCTAGAGETIIVNGLFGCDLNGSNTRVHIIAPGGTNYLVLMAKPILVDAFNPGDILSIITDPAKRFIFLPSGYGLAVSSSGTGRFVTAVGGFMDSAKGADRVVGLAEHIYDSPSEVLPASGTVLIDQLFFTYDNIHNDMTVKFSMNGGGGELTIFSDELVSGGYTAQPFHTLFPGGDSQRRLWIKPDGMSFNATSERGERHLYEGCVFASGYYL